MEIGKMGRKFRVFIENSALGAFHETEEVIEDLCNSCRLQLREFFHPTEPAPVLINTDKIRKEVEEDFWATHDPSGGDLPPEDDENLSWGGTTQKNQTDSRSDEAAGQETKKSRKCGSRKNLRIAEGRLVGEGNLRGDARFSGDGIQSPEDGEGQ